MTKNNSGFHCKLFIFLDFFKSTGDFFFYVSLQYPREAKVLFSKARGQHFIDFDYFLNYSN